MRVCVTLSCLLLFAACDNSRVYELDHDFAGRTWQVKDKPEFEFDITDSVQLYNVYYKIRNSSDYPFSRIFVQYNLIDPKKVDVQNKLLSNNLFDQKTGMPLGSSSIGDKFDHQFLILGKYKFNRIGKHTIKFEQFMRTDTLPGIEALGVRVEKVRVD